MANPQPEEPNAVVTHVRVCEGASGQPLALLGVCNLINEETLLTQPHGTQHSPSGREGYDFVMARGHRREAIFLDDEDRRFFLHTIQEVVCWLTKCNPPSRDRRSPRLVAVHALIVPQSAPIFPRGKA